MVSRGEDAPPPAADPVLELPKYTVRDQLKLPKPESWRYGKIPGFEVLSAASPANTQRFLRDFRQFQQVVDVVWPPLRQAAPAVPGSMVLYDGGRAPDLLEMNLKAVGDDIIEFTPLEPVAGRVASRFSGNDEAVCIVVDLNRPDASEQFFREYVSFLFSRTEAGVAPWLREGVARLLAGVEFSDQWIKVGKIDSERFGDFTARLGRKDTATLASERIGFGRAPDTAAGVGRSADDDGRPATPNPESAPMGPNLLGAFPSLAEMLQVESLDLDQRFLAHAFVHLCLYGRGQRFQKPFFIYVARTNGGRGSEEIFRECFGMSTKAMQDEIAAYVQAAIYQTVTFRAGKGEGLDTPPAVELRSATQAEIGRIKGEGLILAGRTDIARLPLLAPYIRGEHDADLLASLGLHELHADRKEQTRKLLELATRGGTKRARAYLELAQLRRAALPADRASSGAPPAPVIELLRQAATFEPPLIEVYEMIANEWLQCSAPPPASDLALLEKGAVRFQRKLKLVYDTARLLAAGGQPERAARLASWGAQHAPALRDKERFAQLLATLPVPPPSAPK